MAPYMSETPSESAQSSSKSKMRRYKLGALIPDIDQRGDNPVTIRLSDEELGTGITRPETIQALLTYFHRDGFVVLENAIPDHLTDSLYTAICNDTETYLAKPFLQFNQGATTKNISQVPPLNPQYLLKEFYANTHILHLLENLLGPQPELRFINSNVALPGATSRQAVHSDVNHAWPSIPFGVVLNTYLQDTDASNGATEIWCGTHQNCYDQTWQQVGPETGWIRKEAIQHRARTATRFPPTQPTVRKGSICIRDLRLWHAGMPNRTDKARVMLAVDYFAKWYGCPMKVKLPGKLRDRVEREWEISCEGVEWVDGVDSVDHLNQAFELNMTQDPAMYILQTEKGVEDWRARETGRFDFDRGKVTSENYWTPEV